MRENGVKKDVGVSLVEERDIGFDNHESSIGEKRMVFYLQLVRRGWYSILSEMGAHLKISYRGEPPSGLPASRKQEVFLYGALAMIAIGIGGIKPCVSTFGADQFDETDASEAENKHSFFNWFYLSINVGGNASEAENKHSFFNWFYLSINVGGILGIGGVGYVSQKKGVGCGNVGGILGIGGVGYVSQKKGVGCGFAVSAVVSAVSLISVIAGY
ncbi:uncharacterized protein A4U43_C01F18600 [Asparagus officinalis]|uniref:Uncharacterized protein n=1 Tax=Asparagus officinalis TaxID=4686 RepID=A0A5P1FV11_ASPOF|nr:uncharacterized protein A4U43_C01F18600 [Asparagus officinalis]